MGAFLTWTDTQLPTNRTGLRQGYVGDVCLSGECASWKFTGHMCEEICWFELTGRCSTAAEMRGE